MTSFFQYARQITEEDVPEESPAIFEEAKRQRVSNIIPPIGIADPRLVESFQQNMDDEEKILNSIKDLEAYRQETPSQTAVRETLSHGARAAEGFFGGIGSFMKMIVPDLYSDEEFEPRPSFDIREKIPTVETLREFTKEKTGQYLEPKEEKQKISQEVAGDIGSMFSTPGLGAWQKLILPIGGQAMKQIIKSHGGSDKEQEYGKLGFMMLSSIAHLGNAPVVARNALHQAENMIPRGLSFSARPTQNALNNIRQSEWYRTGRTPSKGPAFDEIERIEQSITQNGMIDGRQAMQLRRDINEARRQLGGFSLTRPVQRRQALAYLDQVDNALIQSMENYGQRVNPQWWNQYQMANEAYRVTQRSRLISDFIQQHARPLQSETAKTLLHLGAGAVGSQVPALSLAAVPYLGAAKSIQIANRMIRSPILRNHYLDVLRAASSGNLSVYNKALEKFDIEANKMESGKSQK